MSRRSCAEPGCVDSVLLLDRRRSLALLRVAQTTIHPTIGVSAMASRQARSPVVTNQSLGVALLARTAPLVPRHQLCMSGSGILYYSIWGEGGGAMVHGSDVVGWS